MLKRRLYVKSHRRYNFSRKKVGFGKPKLIRQAEAYHPCKALYVHSFPNYEN